MSLSLTVSTKVIAQDLIRVTLSRTIAVDNNLVDLNSWAIAEVTSGLTSVDVKGIIFDPTFDIISFVNVEVSRMSIGSIYQLTVSNLKNDEGSDLNTATSKFQNHITKIDSILKSMSRMYASELGSNIREILSAIAIGDDEIGGESSNV